MPTQKPLAPEGWEARNDIHAEGPQILGSVVQNLVFLANFCQVFVHAWFKKKTFFVIGWHIRVKDVLTFLVIVIPCLSCGPIVKMCIRSRQIFFVAVVFFRYLRNLKSAENFVWISWNLLQIRWNISLKTIFFSRICRIFVHSET